jgi:UDP-3-O-[3-hydroxymyristoyl] N-acetylglucosamine deacetylase
MAIHPSAENSGITFVRSDVEAGLREIPASWDNVVDTRLCTVLGNRHGATVGTVEHLMAALRGCGVDNAAIELSGPEVPVMDGSASEFVRIIKETGLKAQAVPRRIIRILKDVHVTEGEKFAGLMPAEEASFSGEIDFAHPCIGEQKFETTLVNGNFAHDLADCRTFGFLHEVEWMRSQGLAKGGSLENAIVLGDQGVINPEGLRHRDEFIRHKLLDAVGDMYLAGGPILGAYHGNRSGHALNNALLHRLMSDTSAYEVVDHYGESGAVNLNSELPLEMAVCW